MVNQITSNGILKVLNVQWLNELREKRNDKMIERPLRIELMRMVEFIDELLNTGYKVEEFRVPATIGETWPWFTLQGKRVNRFSNFDLKKWVQLKTFRLI